MRRYTAGDRVVQAQYGAGTIVDVNEHHTVIEFDEHGKFVQAWGGPSDGYDWPDLEHSLTVDYQDRVWVAGSNPINPVAGSRRSDDMILRFTPKGKFLSQLGRSLQTIIRILGHHPSKKIDNRR